jgi:hypothetical protein
LWIDFRCKVANDARRFFDDALAVASRPKHANAQEVAKWCKAVKNKLPKEVDAIDDRLLKLAKDFLNNRWPEVDVEFSSSTISWVFYVVSI